MEETTVVPEPVEPAVETAPESPAESVPEAPEKQQTVAEILNSKPEAKLVPESALIGEKKGRKEAEKLVKELQQQIAAGATPEEVSEDIDSLLNEFGLDDTNKAFYSKLTKAMEAKADRIAEAKAAARFAPLEEKNRSEQLDKIFAKHYTDAIEAAPEYKGIANADVIKTLSLDPRNADKTFSQIIEDTYGGAIQGKRTIETTTARGGKDPETVDVERAQNDEAYLERVLANPRLKEEYNANLIKRLTGGRN